MFARCAHMAAVLAATLLADFHFIEPETAWASGFSGFDSPVATESWRMQSHTSGSYANSTGTATLDDDGGGGLTDRTAVGLWDGSIYTGRECWEATSGNHQLECSDSSIGEMEGQDLAVRIIFKWNDVLSSDYLIAKQNGFGTAGWALYSTSLGRMVLYISDGSTNYTNSLSTQNLNDRAWHAIDILYDDSANEVSVKVDGVEVISADSISATGSHTQSSRPITVNGNISGSASGLQSSQLGGLILCEGSDANTMYDEDYWRQGADPTELITNINRDCTMAVPLGDSGVVGFFAPGQLPIGGDGIFTTGLGIRCNTAVENLIDYSEDITQWTTVGSPTVASSPDGDDPNGLRNAYSVVAGAANDQVYRTFTTTAGTEYTIGVQIKDAAGSGVSGRVIFHDESNGADLASQAFTSGADYDGFVTVTATTNTGQVSSSLRVEIDTVSEGVYPTYAMAVEADGLGVYIATRGSTVVLVDSEYDAVDTAGWITSEKGECEIIWRSDFPTTPQPDAQLCQLVPVSGKGNRRFIRARNNGQRPQLYIWDSSGHYADDITKISPDGSCHVQENTLVCQWDATGGLAGGLATYLKHNSDTAVTAAKTWTATETITEVQIGHTHGGNQIDGYIQRIRFWDKAGGATV